MKLRIMCKIRMPISGQVTVNYIFVHEDTDIGVYNKAIISYRIFHRQIERHEKSAGDNYQSIFYHYCHMETTGNRGIFLHPLASMHSPPITIHTHNFHLHTPKQQSSDPCRVSNFPKRYRNHF